MAKKEKKQTNEVVEKNTKNAVRDMALEYGPFIIILLFILIIRLFIASPIKVQGTSMLPTLEQGDYMLLYKLKMKVKGLNRFDIVVVKLSDGDIIKRVIGLPGETVKYEVKEEEGETKGILYVDGKIIEEEFLDSEAKASTCIRENNLCSEGVTLGQDEYFVMGDNRRVSHDSRYIGPIKKDQIKGITELRLFPFSKFGNIKAGK
ncbi:MAG: signal peptidase I [Bacilli bacterium]|nr:signal peptidase I [Bacilli bacterium]